MMPGKRIILTGLPGSGKSTLCQVIIEYAINKDVDLKGVASPAMIEEGGKVGIELLDLATGQRYQLARLRNSSNEATRISTIRWAFNPEIMKIGSGILASSTPCELLIIDELGPLEFVRGEGWLEGLAAIDSGLYQSALIVIRPGLLETAQKRWPDAQTIEINSVEQVPDLTQQAIQLLGLSV